jgi:hypothetical protein
MEYVERFKIFQKNERLVYLTIHPSGQSSDSSGLCAGAFGVSVTSFGKGIDLFGLSGCSNIYTSVTFGLSSNSFSAYVGSFEIAASQFGMSSGVFGARAGVFDYFFWDYAHYRQFG